ncbi:hypothetical protein KIPB_008870, partial [Kipferlia bialata]
CAAFAVSNSRVGFVCGRYLCHCSLSGVDYQFTRIPDTVHSIVQIEVSPGTKFMATIEKIESMATQIGIYGLPQVERLATLTLPVEAQHHTVVGLSFSAEGRRVVLQFGAPEYGVMIYNWHRSSLVDSIVLEAAAHRTIMNPFDGGTLVSVGPHLIRYIRLVEGKARTFAPLKLTRISGTFHDAVWLTETRLAVVGAVSGEILIFDNGAFTGFVPSRVLFPAMSPRAKKKNRRQFITSVLHFMEGVILGTVT